MEIEYKNKKLEKQCSSLAQAKRDFPERVAKKLMKQINFIDQAESLQDIINYPPMRFHGLKSNLKGYYAIDIDGKKTSYRLVVEFGNLTKEQVFSGAESISIIRIKEVSNHYE